MTAPQFRLMPGTAWSPAAPPSPGPAAGPAAGPDVAPTQGASAADFRNSRWDRPALALIADPSWLLAPLYARDVAGLAVDAPGATDAPVPGPLDPPVGTGAAGADVDAAAAAADWPAWWTAALAFRPGTPAPRVADLIGGSAALQALWTESASGFATWTSTRPAPPADAEAAARRIERDALAGFAARNGRDPGRWTVRILQIPVAGHYLYSPEDRRIVVSAALRHDAEAYADALAAELPRHF